MAYATLEMVKYRLGITGTQNDTELTAKIAAADAEIDASLQEFTSVPLTTVPQIVKDISADIAASLWHEEKAPATQEASRLRVRAEKALEKYIHVKYKAPTWKQTPRYREEDLVG